MSDHTQQKRIENRKALFDYEIIEELEAGIQLSGPEVKSLRAGQANLKGSYITTHTGRPVLVGCHISEYKNNTGTILDPKRERTLLLSRRQIAHLDHKVKGLGATIVPVEIYTKGNLFKIRIALAKGRKRWQKKQVIKERDLDRETARKYRI